MTTHWWVVIGHPTLGTMAALARQFTRMALVAQKSCCLRAYVTVTPVATRARKPLAYSPGPGKFRTHCRALTTSPTLRAATGGGAQLLAAGEAHVRAGRLSAAMQDLQAAVRTVDLTDTELARAHHLLARLLHNQSDFSAALPHFHCAIAGLEKAHGNLAELARMYHHAGLSSEGAGQSGEAAALYQQSLELHNAIDSSATGAAARAELYMLRGRALGMAGASPPDLLLGVYENAVKEFQKADPPRPLQLVEARTQLARVYALHGDMDVAQREFAASLAAAGHVADQLALVHLGWAETQTARGDVIAAREAYQAALDAALREPDTIDPRLFVEVYHNLGEAWALTGDISRAFDLIAAAVPHASKAYGDETLVMADLRQRLGECLLHLGEISRALPELQAAWVVAEKLLEGSDDTLARLASSLARALHQQGDVARAVEYYDRALGIQSQAPAGQARDVAQAATFAQLGFVYLVQEEKERALGCLLQAHELWNQHPPSVNPAEREQLVNVDAMLGLLHQQRLEYAKAISFYEAALPLLVQLQGADTTAVTQMSLQLVTCYTQNSQNTDAVDLFERLETKRLDDPQLDQNALADTYNAVGYAYRAMQKFGRALEAYEQALGKRQAIFGSEHRLVAAVYGNMAAVHLSKQRLAKAAELFEKSLAIMESVGDKEQAALLLTNLGHVYGRSQQYARAAECFERSLPLYQHNAVAMAFNLCSMGSMHLYGDKVDAGRLYLQQGLEIYRHLPDHAGDVARAEADFANILEVLGRAEKDQ